MSGPSPDEHKTASGPTSLDGPRNEPYTPPNYDNEPKPDDYDSLEEFMAAIVPFLIDQGVPDQAAVAMGIQRWNEKSYDDETRTLRSQLEWAKYDESQHPRDDHGRWTDGGFAVGSQSAQGQAEVGHHAPIETIPMQGLAGSHNIPTIAENPTGVHNIPGIGDVDQYIESHPMQPGERPYEYDSRLVKGLPAETQNDVLFYTREKYPPVSYLADGAAAYREAHGLPEPQADILSQQVDLTKANEVARAFEGMPDMSNDPRTRAAYEDFKAQNAEQWKLLTDPVEKGGLGVKVDFVKDPEPYQSAKAQADDLRDNHHLSIASGLGGEHQASMTTEEYDRFRAVHDAFGHAAIGSGFDRHGEYEAWLQHETMYTGMGARAMSSEYHGVNSALWSGAQGSPGTGKTVLLPDRLTDSPWDAQGNLVRKGIGELLVKAAQMQTDDAEALKYFIDKVGLDSAWAHAYATPPWHPCVPGSDPTYEQKSTKPCCDECAEKREAAFKSWASGWMTPDEMRAKFDENEPRDDHGRWTDSGGGSKPYESGGGGGHGIGLLPNSGSGDSKNDPIRTTNVHTAALALRDGKYVELNQENGTSTLLAEIDRMVKDAQDPKNEGKLYDLCKASIPGSNLNCDQAVVESRTGMPQLKGIPTPGSEADKLPKNDKGEVDLAKAFTDHLQNDLGIKTIRTTVPAENLRASQRELNGGKVAGMADAIAAGTLPPGAIFTTRDNYVLDGHHRWAANVGTEYKQGKSISMDVDQIDMNITDAIREANAFTEKMGIPHAAKGWSQAIAKARATLTGQEAEPAHSDTANPTKGKAMSSTKRAVYEAEFKSAPIESNPTGEFEAIVSVFNNVDLQGDRVMPGAFKSWLQKAKATGDPIPVVWSHQWDVPSSHIGVIDPAQMRETPQGLVVKGSLDIHGADANPVAKQVHKLLMRKSVKGWSFAYDVHNEKRAKDGANELLDLGIIEIGPTLKGANPEAQTIGAKAIADAESEYEQRMKAGRAISQDNKDRLQKVHDMLGQCQGHLQNVMGDGYGDTGKSLEALRAKLVTAQAKAASPAALRQVYDLVEQIEDLVEKAETILEQALGIPDDDANDEATEGETTSGKSVGAKADKYTAQQLRDMLAAGHAMRNANGDPAYPIGDAEDLGNAIHAVGRGGASANAIRKYVMRRARELKLTNQIPDTWNADGSLKSMEYMDPFEDSTAADGATSEVEETASTGSEPDDGREPGAKSHNGTPDSETLDLLRRIEEMRLT